MGFLLQPVFIGGIGFRVGGSGRFAAACLMVSEDPVSIWTTFLKEVVSAWTKVVGYGLFGSGLGMGVGGGDGWWLVVVVVEFVLLL